METVSTLNGVSPDMLWTFVVVLVGLCISITAILNCYEKIQNLHDRRRKPTESARMDVLEMLANDKRRLDAHEEAINSIRGKQRSLEEGQRAVCAGVMALLEHELHNGNSEQMEKASEDINTYLLNK